MASQNEDRGARLEAARLAVELSQTDTTLTALDRVRLLDELAAAEDAWVGVKPQPDFQVCKRLRGAAQDAMSAWRASAPESRSVMRPAALVAIKDFETAVANLKGANPHVPAGEIRAWREELAAERAAAQPAATELSAVEVARERACREMAKWRDIMSSKTGTPRERIIATSSVRQVVLAFAAALGVKDEPLSHEEVAGLLGEVNTAVANGQPLARVVGKRRPAPNQDEDTQFSDEEMASFGATAEDLPPSDEDGPAPAVAVERDPAEVLAQCVVRRVLATPAVQEVMAERGWIIAATVSAENWLYLIKNAWLDEACVGEEVIDKAGFRRRWDNSKSKGGDRVAVALREEAHDPKKKVRAGYTSDEDEAVGDAVARGLPVLGLSPAPSADFLPGMLVEAADLTVDLSITPADVLAASEILSGGETAWTWPTVAECVGIEPRHARMAWRRGSADEWVRRMRRLAAASHAKAAGQAPDVDHEGLTANAPLLSELHGLGDAANWGTQLAEEMREYAAGRLAWQDVTTKGVLVYGPPGTGKTTFALSLAKTAGCGIIVTGYGKWLGRDGAHQGTMLRAMSEDFARAKAMPGGCVLLIDEADSFKDRAVNVGSHHHAWDSEVLNALLPLLESGSRPGVIVVGACNGDIDRLDAAMLRPGRLDRHCRISLPSAEELLKIYAFHLKQELAGVDLTGVALESAGYSGADVEQAVRLARSAARHAGRPMAMSDLHDAVSGTETRSAAVLSRLATHEAGHAVLALAHQPDLLQSVTIRKAGTAGGAVRMSDNNEAGNPQDLQGALVTLLAGRAAEEVVHGCVSMYSGGGKGSDLARATWLCGLAAANAGMHPALGLRWRADVDMRDVRAALRAEPALAAAVDEMLAAAWESTLEEVRKNEAAIKAVSEALLKQRTLSRAQVQDTVRSTATSRHRSATSAGDPLDCASAKFDAQACTIH